LSASSASSPAFPRRSATRGLAPVVVLLDDAAFVVEAEPRRSRVRDQFPLVDDRSPPFDSGAVTDDERLAHPDLGLALLLAERPARIVERRLWLAERVRALDRVFCVDGRQQVGIERAPR